MPRPRKPARRTPKVLSATLYCYVEPESADFANEQGKALFGSVSAYVNALICKDRGVTPKLGDWKAKGEAKKAWLEQRRKNMVPTKPLYKHQPPKDYDVYE